MQSKPFGNYQLHDCIYEGKTTAIYRATRMDAGDIERPVAVKQLLTTSASDEDILAAFHLEAKIAMQLTHGNVAQVLDSGKIDGINYISIEYIHGKELRQIFGRVSALGQRLPIPFACHAIIKICQGLSYIHERKSPSGNPLQLLHGDISPENILISYDGEVKIIDFGSAKHAEDDSDLNGNSIGKITRYSSPEQVQGLKIDCRTDVFSIGVCLYELITGRPLFSSDTDISSRQNFNSLNIDPPSSINPNIPNELEKVVFTALNSNPEDRYSSVLAMHDELQSFMYSNGYLYSRKEMSAYLRELFSEELEDEVILNQPGSTFEDEESKTDDTGLIAFDDLEPVSAVSALIPMETIDLSENQPAESEQPEIPSFIEKKPASMPPPIPKSGYTATLLGVPPTVDPEDVQENGAPSPWDLPADSEPSASDSVNLPPSQVGSAPPIAAATRSPSVPPTSPFAPRAVTRPPSAPSMASVPPPAYNKPAASIPPSLTSIGMDFDSDDEATRIYDASARLSAPVSPESPQVPIGLPSPFEQSTKATSQIRPFENTISEIVEWTTENRPTRLVLASVGLIVVLSIITYFVFQEPSPSSVHLSSMPKDTTVTINGKAISDTMSPFVIDDLKTDTTYRIEISKNGYRSWTTDLELKPNQTLVLPEITLETLKTETGFSVDTVPSQATVFLDGNELEQRTPVRLTDLSPGIHKIRIERGTTYLPWETEIQVPEGQVLALSKITLQTKPIKQTQRESSVASSSRKTSVKPISSVSRTTSTRVTRPRATRTPKVASRQPRKSPTRIPRQKSIAAKSSGVGTLRINSRPWSQVYVNNRLIGNTPQMNIKLTAGRHTVTLVSPTFGIRKSINVNIGAGKTVTKIITLTPGG